jgi:hypothetical protein
MAPTRDRDRRATRVEQAVELLAAEVRERLARHPLSHLADAAGEELAVSMTLATSTRNGRVTAAAGELSAEIERAIAGALAHRAAFRPGRVLCLRCGGAECEHAAPRAGREVFAGWGATGLPRWVDLPQLLLERGDERVDRLFGSSPALLAHPIGEPELTRELLPAYRRHPSGYRVHAAVAAGWYRLPDPSGRPEPMAVSFLVVSTRPEGSHRRFGLNPVGAVPDGGPLEQQLDRLGDRLGELPWLEAARWGQAALAQIEQRAGSAEPPPAAVERRLEGLAGGLARRLEKTRRSAERKTRHARRRHQEGDRPTRMALADLARAAAEDFLVDTRRETLVVLGDRGRAHVFSPAGKLVTSIRYNPASIVRRREREHWRPATRDEIDTLRIQVAGEEKD